MMITIKLLTIIIFSITSITLNSSESLDWKIVNDDDTYYIKNNKYNIEHRIRTTGPYPRVKSVRPYKKNSRYLLIEYFAGNSGTSRGVDTYRLIIFDTKKKRVVVQHNYKKNDPGVKWEFLQNKIIIKDRSYLKDILIEL